LSKRRLAGRSPRIPELATMLSRTFLARSSSALLERLASHPELFKQDVLLFALSASANDDAGDLTRLVDALRPARGSARVGCLSTPLREGITSCSILSLESERGNAFKSTLPGRAAAQVGRWHALRKVHDEELADSGDGGLYTQLNAAECARLLLGTI
jgi:hypothetical protein